MKAVVVVALLALVGLAASQAPTTTKCETILSVLSSNQNLPNGDESLRIRNATAFLTDVVSTTVGLIAADGPITGVKTSLYRYFNGTSFGAPYPNILRSPANAAVLVPKLINWFGGYLGCAAEAGLTPTPAASLGLYESHKHLKISQADARLFNVRVMQAIATVLAGQGIAVAGPVADLAGQISGDLEALIPSYTVNNTASTFCDKYSSLLANAGLQSNLSNFETYGTIDYTAVLGAAVNTEYQTNLAARGPAYAFWFYFIKHGVVLGELVPAQTGGARLARYFNGSISGVANFFANGGNNNNLAVLINKLVGWFGRVPAIACSDAEFAGIAATTGAVSNGAPINLAASHYPLGITAADNTAFNDAVVRQAGNALTPLGLSSAEATAVRGILDSVSSQIIAPAPSNPPVAVAAPTGSAPVAPKAPSVATPKAAGSAVVASFGLIAVALVALLL